MDDELTVRKAGLSGVQCAPKDALATAAGKWVGVDEGDGRRGRGGEGWKFLTEVKAHEEEEGAE